jgi:hypothetical protein
MDNISSSEIVQKILIENMKPFIHLKINSIFHIVIIQQLWLMYSIDSMQHPSLNHLPNFPIQRVHCKKQKTSNAFSSSHSYDILGVRMLWKPKEARILKNFIEF